MFNNKYMIGTTAVIATAGLFFALSTQGQAKATKHHHHHKLQPGQTKVDAKNIQQGKSLRISTQQSQRMVQIFRDQMDSDNDGQVDQAEFITHAKKQGCDSFVASHLFDAIDVNNNELLDLDEIFDFVAQMEAGNMRVKLDCVFSFLVGGSNKHALSRRSCQKVFACCGYSKDKANSALNCIFKVASSSSAVVSRKSFVDSLAQSNSNNGDDILEMAAYLVEEICGRKFQKFEGATL